jgi:hypothetical protein
MRVEAGEIEMLQSGGTCVTNQTGTNSGESVIVGVVWRDTGATIFGVDIWSDRTDRPAGLEANR